MAGAGFVDPISQMLRARIAAGEPATTPTTDEVMAEVMGEDKAAAISSAEAILRPFLERARGAR
jgi:hypothetical protein